MYKTEEFFVNMGPQHPSTHGVLRLVLKLDGEKVLDVVPHIGYLHRALEKMAEHRTYLQFIPITDRLDYSTSMSSNAVFVLALEELAGISPPRRAEYLRVIALELNRLASHLLWYGTMALDLGAYTPFLYSFREREKILDIFEMVCGARLTYNYFRPGGVSFDIDDKIIKAILDFCVLFKKRIVEYDQLLTGNVIFVARTEGRGVLSKDLAVNYGVTGPTLRGCGVKWDVRKGDPYLIYNEIDFDVPAGKNGDAFDRYNVRMEEMRQSIRIIEQCLAKLPKGKHKIPVPYNIKPPAKEVYTRIESPRGEIGTYILSKGEAKPWRVKFRAPSFSNLSALPEVLRGVNVADIMAIMASFDIVLPETDR